MKWCFQHGWIGEIHAENEPDATHWVIDGDRSATEFFPKYCDGKLTNEDRFNSGILTKSQLKTTGPWWTFRTDDSACSGDARDREVWHRSAAAASTE